MNNMGSALLEPRRETERRSSGRGVKGGQITRFRRLLCTAQEVLRRPSDASQSLRDALAFVKVFWGKKSVVTDRVKQQLGQHHSGSSIRSSSSTSSRTDPGQRDLCGDRTERTSRFRPWQPASPPRRGLALLRREAVLKRGHRSQLGFSSLFSSLFTSCMSLCPMFCICCLLRALRDVYSLPLAHRDCDVSCSR